MERGKLHDAAPEFSKIILGAWRWNDRTFEEGELEALVSTSIELGITTIDHADIYGNYECEKIFGELLQKHPEWRDKLEVVTKCGIKMMSDKYPERKLGTYDLSANHIIQSAEQSLRNLNLDSIDLLLIHRPSPLMNADEVSAGFSELKETGKVKSFGVSNFTNEQFSHLQSRLDFPLVTNQLEISLTHNEPMFDGSLDYLQERRVSPMAWSPLGGGSIFKDQEMMSQLNPLCEKYEVSIGALLIMWLLAHPSKIFPVIGTTNASRLGEMSGLKQLEREDWFIMLKIARGYDVP